MIDNNRIKEMVVKLKNEVREMLKAELKERKMKQTELAKAMGISRQYMSHIMSTEGMTFNFIIKVFDYFGYTVKFRVTKKLANIIGEIKERGL